MDIGDRALGRATISGAAGSGGYGAVARSLHWLVAALAVIVVSLGWTIEWAPLNTPIRSDILQVHRSVGVAILVLMMFRAMWRLRHPPPPLPVSVGRAQAWRAHLTHLGLYLIFVVMPVSGLLNAAAAGHEIGFFACSKFRHPGLRTSASRNGRSPFILWVNMWFICSSRCMSRARAITP